MFSTIFYSKDLDKTWLSPGTDSEDQAAGKIHTAPCQPGSPLHSAA